MENFRYKTEEELKDQVETVSNSLGERIIPSDVETSLDNLSIDQIKTKYPERYKIYIELLRKHKNNQDIEDVDLEKMSIWVKSLNNLDSYIELNNHSLHEKDAREKRQHTVFEDIRDSLERGETSGYIKLPTGVGKTVLFSRVVESLGLKSLIVVPSKILVSQTGEKLEEFTDVEFGKYFQESKDYSRPVTVTTYLSLIRGLQSGKIEPDKYGVIILDEVHKALGPKSAEAIEKFNCVKLGFTATPEYSRDKHVQDILEHEIHSMSIIEAVEEGLINRFKSYLAYTETDFSKVKIKNKEGYDERDIEHTINNKERNLSAVQLYKERFNNLPAVAYCGSIDHALDLKKLFIENGVVAEAISGSNTKEERDEILLKYKNRDIQVLCNAKLLIEGFDAPFASVCLNLHPTLSKVSAEQRAGRVLRLDPDNPEKWAYIVDFIDKNIKVPPITFPEIAQASEASEEEIVDIETIDRDIIPGEKRKYLKDLEVGGLNVVVDAQEVLRFSMKATLDRETVFGSEKFINFEDLKKIVHEIGIKSQAEYVSQYKEHDGWPSNPQAHYPEWKGWPDFLSKEIVDYIDFETFKKELIKNNIKSSIEYFAVYKDHPGWPASPHRFYRESGWSDWGTLLGKEKKNFISFDELKKEVRDLGIKTKSEYLRMRNEYPNWPSVPSRVYKESGWISWVDLFDKTENIPSFEDLKKDVQRLNIGSSSEYSKFLLENPNWPQSPQHSYKNKGWVDWYDFLGKEKPKWLNFDELKKEVKEAGVTTQKQYQQESRNRPNWPADPYTRFKDEGWISWPDLFGKEYREHLPFDRFKEEVKEAGLKNRNQYRVSYKKHKGWPARADDVYRNSGWTSWEDLFL